MTDKAMRRWECIVCGWVYDEALGAPDHGVPAGTRWEDVPEDFLCPDCGVGKEDFELLEETAAGAGNGAASVSSDDQGVVVIVGTGMSGYNVAKEFRKHDASTPLVIISGDDGRAYSKPMLSTGLTRKTEADDLAVATADEMAEQLSATVKTLTHIEEIDTDRRTVKTARGESITYTALVLALGAKVIEPPLEGNGLSKVYSVNSLLDYARFRDALRSEEVKKLLVIGAGLIGSEFSNDLLNGGYTIEAVDPMGYVLPTLLPEEAGKAVQKALGEQGVNYHFGTVVKSIDHAPDGSDLVVCLDNGTKFRVDLVVSAVGVRPDIDLAQRAGIKTGRGILTNSLLQTSAEHVYALGDCAEVEGHVLYYVAPLMACARALGKTLAGTPTRVSYPPMPVTIKTPSCPVVVSPPAGDAVGDWRVEKNGCDVRAEFRNAQGRLLGFALTGKRTAEKIELQKELPPLLE